MKIVQHTKDKWNTWYNGFPGLLYYSINAIMPVIVEVGIAKNELTGITSRRSWKGNS